LFSENFDFYEAHEKGVAFVFFLVPIPIFICIWIYEQWKWLKTLKAEKSTAELALLKSQINPHFFFNTLNNLYGLTVEKSEEAPEVVLKLSDMMRYTIYEGKKETVALKNEITYLENYIELHKIRYQKKVDISFIKNIKEDRSISPLLYIILLENAFKHGVERLTEDAYIHIEIESTSLGVSFTIENNFEENTDTEHSKGIGLDNLKQRLNLIYPDKHSLNIEESNLVYKATLVIENP
jgi:LytS/YehU family sensor histidine kinase